MYCALADLKEQMPEETLLDLTDDEDAGAFVVTPTPNAAYKRVLAAIVEADGVIDMYLASRYDLPLVEVPAQIKSISIHLTICNLFKRKHEGTAPEGLAQRRRDQIDLLKNIQAGTIKIPNMDKLPPREIISSKTENDIEFTDTLLGLM